MLFIILIVLSIGVITALHVVNGLKKQYKRLIIDVNASLSQVEKAFGLAGKTTGEVIAKSIDQSEKKLLSTIQSKSDILKSQVDKIKAVVGPAGGSWSATATEICTDVPEVPTIAERLGGLEEYLGVSFRHDITEDRGYKPTGMGLGNTFGELNNQLAMAEYPVCSEPKCDQSFSTRKPSKKSRK